MKLNLEKLGQNIREYRQEAGLTQTDLADMCLTLQQNVARWESGKAEITLTKLYMVAAAIGMNDPTNLLRGVELENE